MNVCLDLIHVAFTQLTGIRKFKAQIKKAQKINVFIIIHQKGRKCESNICGLYIIFYIILTHIYTADE